MMLCNAVFVVKVSTINYCLCMFSVSLPAAFYQQVNSISILSHFLVKWGLKYVDFSFVELCFSFSCCLAGLNFVVII